MTPIVVTMLVQAPVAVAWRCYTEPAHIMQWNQASPDWHCPAASNDLRVGGRFVSTMAARDGSFQFDFSGTYTEVKEHAIIAYKMDDARTARVVFAADGNATRVTTTFDPESENPPEMQKEGWQAILSSFARHAEA